MQPIQSIDGEMILRRCPTQSCLGMNCKQEKSEKKWSANERERTREREGEETERERERERMRGRERPRVMRNEKFKVCPSRGDLWK